MVCADTSLAFGPFQGVDLSALSSDQREIIAQASKDFDQVLKGKQPIYAVVDDEVPLPADGGTQYFNGKGYRFTVVKSLSSFGRLSGFVYGPVVSFAKPFALGNLSEISSLRFYTPEQLQQLVSEK